VVSRNLKKSSAEGAAVNPITVQRNVGPAGLDFIFRPGIHGLTAAAIECRACGALGTQTTMTLSGESSMSSPFKRFHVIGMITWHRAQAAV